MFINHPDHRAAGETLLDAVYPLARNRPSFPELLDEGLEPYSVKEVYLWTASDVNFEVDITDCLDVKFEALAKHDSQIEDMEGMRERLKHVLARPRRPLRRALPPHSAAVLADADLLSLPARRHRRPRPRRRRPRAGRSSGDLFGEHDVSGESFPLSDVTPARARGARGRSSPPP